MDSAEGSELACIFKDLSQSSDAVKNIGGATSKWWAESVPHGWNRVNWSAKYWGGQWPPWPPQFRHHCKVKKFLRLRNLYKSEKKYKQFL